jgi:soluble lytic murein transglycosylase
MRKAALAALALSLTIPAAGAETVSLPGDAPLPEPRPYAPVNPVAATSLPFAAGTLLQDDIAALQEGLDALAKGDIARARQARDDIRPKSFDHRILTWAIAMFGGGSVTSAELADAADALSGWPGLNRLRAAGERALYREKPEPGAVIEAFADGPPVTYQGVLALTRAHLALGDKAAAKRVIAPFWRSESLETAQESAILKEFGSLLTTADHRHRMERMLYADRIRSAERVASAAGAEALAKAWAAVIRNDRNAGKLLDAVPVAQRSSGYYFAKARHLRRAEKFRDAAKALLVVSGDQAAQVDPDTWWFERRALSRELIEIDDAETAYRIAARHKGGKTVTLVDAAFHAGWYALRKLGDAETAARHFAEIAKVADGPISTSRAFYWLGRAAEAGGPGDATAHYERAAQFGTAFYGQLAAARLGHTTIPAAYPAPSETDRKNFLAREAVRAIERLELAGHANRAEMLYRDLASEVENAGELALLTSMAERRGNHFLALRVGKVAAQRGLEIGALAHPVGAIPAKASISGAGKALAYAIARQESEFNVGAVSPAGARGLLQLMPGTAKAMAQKSGLPYSAQRLTSDAGYNATLGAAYLSDQLSRFDGSYVLTFVGYNAGPGRANDWIKRYGDPRGRSVEDVVDWVERIPFTETRTYVQRVMENYQVYKMRLTGRANIALDLTQGRR